MGALVEHQMMPHTEFCWKCSRVWPCPDAPAVETVDDLRAQLAAAQATVAALRDALVRLSWHPNCSEPNCDKHTYCTHCGNAKDMGHDIDDCPVLAALAPASAQA